MKFLFVLFVLSAACFIAAPAQAHLIGEGNAESRWYYVFNDHCGNGLGWCANRNLYLNCRHPSGWVHSYSCDYEFREGKLGVPLSHYRYCHITGILAHSTVSSWQENCTGWS